MDERTILAHREAGHVVVGHALGLAVEGVTIVPAEENAGLADIPVDFGLWYGTDNGDEYLEAQLACYVAEAVAEELLTGQEVDFVPGGAYTGDWNGAADCVVELAGADQDLQGEFSGRAFDRARRILRENDRVLSRLADALIEAGELDRKQVAELVKGADDA